MQARQRKIVYAVKKIIIIKMKIDLRDNCFISQGAMIMSDSFVRTDADVQAKRQTD